MTLRREFLIGILVIVSCATVLVSPLDADVLLGDAPIIVTLMTHTDAPAYPPRAFRAETDRIEIGLELYGLDVKMNLEASPEFADADTAGFLQRVQDRGHGIGSHCNTCLTADEAGLVSAIALSKSKVTARIVRDTNVSISGICSAFDWVKAAEAAGFQIIDGGVGYCYLSMPLSARPTGLTDALITSTYFHDPAPLGFENRISPIRLNDASDFAPDSPGIMTLSNGGLGELDSLAEGRINCKPSCVLTEADFEVVYTAIETVKALKGPREVGRINVHVPTMLMTDANRILLTGFLDRLRMYAAANTIAFGTEKDVHDTYEAYAQ
jgi:hypothetical protein